MCGLALRVASPAIHAPAVFNMLTTIPLVLQMVVVPTNNVGIDVGVTVIPTNKVVVVGIQQIWVVYTATAT